MNRLYISYFRRNNKYDKWFLYKFLLDMKQEIEHLQHPTSATRSGVHTRVCFKNSVHELFRIREFLSKVCYQCQIMNENFISELELCVHEACTNIILHGYESEQDMPIILECTIEKDKGLHIDLFDQATPFAPDPSQFLNYENELESGRGLFLMRELSDYLEFRPRKSKNSWNHLYIFKSLIGKEKK